MKILRQLDPIDTALRKSHRLQRREYQNKVHVQFRTLFLCIAVVTVIIDLNRDPTMCGTRMDTIN